MFYKAILLIVHLNCGSKLRLQFVYWFTISFRLSYFSRKDFYINYFSNY